MHGKQNNISQSTGKNQPLVIGIDLGGTHYQIGIVDHDGNILGRSRGKTAEHGDPQNADEVVKRLAMGIDRAGQNANISLNNIQAIGIGAPSPIDPTFQIALHAVNLGWKNYPLAERLQHELSHNLNHPIPVTLDNDVNCAVWGEFILGAGRKNTSILGLWIGTGIGGGLVFNNQLFHGSRGTAGEIGRAVLYPDRNTDSWVYEDWASRKSIEQRIRNAIRQGEQSILSDKILTKNEHQTNSTISSAEIASAVRENDPLTIKIVKHSARMTGIMAANACTLLSLDAIVIGGGIAEEMGETYTAWMRKSFNEAVFPTELRDCEIKVTQLRENAGLLGAALLAQERYKN